MISTVPMSARTSEAVPGSTKPGDSLNFKRIDHLIKWWSSLISTMLKEPLSNIESTTRVKTVKRNGIAVEVVRDDSLDDRDVISSRSTADNESGCSRRNRSLQRHQP